MFVRRSTITILTALIIALLNLVSVLAAPVAGTNLKTASEDFKDLRKVEGQWDDKPFNEDVDAFEGKKHQAMEVSF